MSSDYDYSDEDADYYDDEDVMDTQEDGKVLCSLCFGAHY